MTLHEPGSTSFNVPTVAPSELPVHSGIFFELGPEELARLQRANYAAIGVGVVLVNSAAEVLLVDHKKNRKLDDHTLGITSETVGGFQGTPILAERIIQTIGRCMRDEADLPPEVAQATLRHDANGSYTLSDWPIGTDPNLGRLIGINVALLINDANAARAEAMDETEEIYGAHFETVDNILSGDLPRLRPGTLGCLRSLGEVGLLEPAELQDARLVLPELIEPDFDIALKEFRL